jgi:spermidine/putrescine transport system permease protein
MKSPVFRGYTIAYLIFLYAPIVLLPLFAFNDSKVIAFPLQGFTTLVRGDVGRHHPVECGANSADHLDLCGGSVDHAGALCRPRLDPVQLSGQDRDHGPDHAAAGAARDDRGDVAAGGAAGGGDPLSIFTIILGHVLICTPFAVAILSSAFQSLDKSLEEAAYDLGETPLSTFWLIILPLVMPGIISSLLICFTISLDEFIIAYFLGGK